MAFVSLTISIGAVLLMAVGHAPAVFAQDVFASGEPKPSAPLDTRRVCTAPDPGPAVISNPPSCATRVAQGRRQYGVEPTFATLRESRQIPASWQHGSPFGPCAEGESLVFFTPGGKRRFEQTRGQCDEVFAGGGAPGGGTTVPPRGGAPSRGRSSSGGGTALPNRNVPAAEIPQSGLACFDPPSGARENYGKTPRRIVRDPARPGAQLEPDPARAQSGPHDLTDAEVLRGYSEGMTALRSELREAIRTPLVSDHRIGTAAGDPSWIIMEKIDVSSGLVENFDSTRFPKSVKKIAVRDLFERMVAKDLVGADLHAGNVYFYADRTGRVRAGVWDTDSSCAPISRSTRSCATTSCSRFGTSRARRGSPVERVISRTHADRWS